MIQYLTEEVIIQVNSVGVDLNFAVEHYHYQNMIQFVCGLGPRKGAALLKVRLFVLRVLTLAFIIYISILKLLYSSFRNIEDYISYYTRARKDRQP